MSIIQQNRSLRRSGGGGEQLSPLETARYTSDLLESLRKIANRQGHALLAHLLELANLEARTLARPPEKPPGRGV